MTPSLIIFISLCAHHICYRGKLLFGYIEAELAEKGGYDLIHPDDLTYYAAAHEECKNCQIYNYKRYVENSVLSDTV